VITSTEPNSGVLCVCGGWVIVVVIVAVAVTIAYGELVARDARRPCASAGDTPHQQTTVADLRDREHADTMPYYPEAARLRDRS
jgi:hypothetical protein